MLSHGTYELSDSEFKNPFNKKESEFKFEISENLPPQK